MDWSNQDDARVNLIPRDKTVRYYRKKIAFHSPPTCELDELIICTYSELLSLYETSVATS